MQALAHTRFEQHHFPPRLPHILTNPHLTLPPTSLLPLMQSLALSGGATFAVAVPAVFVAQTFAMAVITCNGWLPETTPLSADAVFWLSLFDRVASLVLCGLMAFWVRMCDGREQQNACIRTREVSCACAWLSGYDEHMNSSMQYRTWDRSELRMRIGSVAW